MTTPHLFPALLRALRKRAGLTRAELATRCGCNVASIVRLEQPGCNASEESLERVARGLGFASTQAMLASGMGCMIDQYGAAAKRWPGRGGDAAVERDSTPRPGPAVTLPDDRGGDSDLVFGGPSGHPLPDRRGEQIEEPGSEECPPKPPHG